MSFPPEFDGEVLPLQACNASNEENADVRTVVTITSPGPSFSPLAVDVLQDDPQIEIPRVFLILDGQETEIPDVHFVDNQTLEAVIDADPPLAAGTYQFQVENPNGNRSEIDGTIEIVDPPVIERIERVDMPDGEELPGVCVEEDQQFRIIGTGFRPDDPPPEIEVVRCTDPNDITTCEEVVAMLEEVMVVSETEVLATLKAGSLPDEPATYGLRLVNPEEPPCTATITVAFTVLSGVVELNTVIPEQGWTGVDTPVQVFGAGFSDPATAWLAGAGPNGDDWPLIDVRVDSTGTRLDAIVPAGALAGGPYDLVIDTEDGCQATLEAAFTVLADASLTVTDVIPPFGWTEAKTPVTILGADFASTPRAYVVIESMSPRLQAMKSTGFVNGQSLNSVVPAGLDVGGPYDVVVINPDGGGGLLEDAFRVTALASPTVENVTPAIGDTQNDTTVTVTGCNFRDPIALEARDPNGMTIAATIDSTPVCNGAAVCDDGSMQCSFQATLPTTTMNVGPYVIRATNLDETTWGDWSLFVVTQPSGKLDVWQAGGVDLITARRKHGGAAGRINNASRYLYALGGDTGQGGEVLGNTEVIPLDVFGDLGAPFQQRNEFATPRTETSVVRSGAYLYAVGGRDDQDALVGTVERARILGFADQPELDDPSVTIGTLEAGAWYYQVAAFYDASHPDNPTGETLPSDEVVIALGIGGGVALNWNAVPDAAGYRIYRTAAPDGASSSEVFLAEVGATTTEFVDDGSMSPDMNRLPLYRGSTGVWVEVGTLNHPRAAASAVVAPDPNGALALYVLGGQGSCAGGAEAEMNCYEFASLSADGLTLGSFADGAGTMVSARAYAAGNVAEPSSSSLVPAGEAWVYVSGGRAATTALEAAQVLAGGELGLFAELTPPASATPGPRSGHGMHLIANNMFLIGGDAGNDLSGPPLDSAQFSQSFDPLPPARTQFSNSTATMLVARALFALIPEGGLFYAVGGATDGTLSNATSNIEFIVQ